MLGIRKREDAKEKHGWLHSLNFLDRCGGLTCIICALEAEVEDRLA